MDESGAGARTAAAAASANMSGGGAVVKTAVRPRTGHRSPAALEPMQRLVATAVSASTCGGGAGARLRWSLDFPALAADEGVQRLQQQQHLCSEKAAVVTLTASTSRCEASTKQAQRLSVDQLEGKGRRKRNGTGAKEEEGTRWGGVVSKRPC